MARGTQAPQAGLVGGEQGKGTSVSPPRKRQQIGPERIIVGNAEADGEVGRVPLSHPQDDSRRGHTLKIAERYQQGFDQVRCPLWLE